MIDENIEFNYSALEGKIKELFDTQDNFSTIIHMNRSTLNQKIQGKIDFTSKNIYIISRALGIKSNEIGKYFFSLKSLETQTIKM